MIVPLETCIDHTMAATVLLDHADDWPEDLPAGRFNAYVAWLSATPQDASNADRNRQQVLSALMLGDGVGHQSYFHLIDQHLVEAQRVAGQVGSGGLCAYIGVVSSERARRRAPANWRPPARRCRTALASLLAGVDDS